MLLLLIIEVAGDELCFVVSIDWKLLSCRLMPMLLYVVVVDVAFNYVVTYMAYHDGADAR